MKALKLIIGTGLLVASFVAAAQAPGTGITGTRHDWSGAGKTSLLQWLDANNNVTTYNTGKPNLDPVTGLQTKTSVTIGLCTKCHTPHQAKSTKLLWNHTLQSVTYNWNVPSTTAGTNFPAIKADTYQGPTTKCLSCHDGLLASTDGMWFNRQFVSGSKYQCVNSATTDCSLDSGHEVAAGTSLSKTHPVAMPYPINGTSNQYNLSLNGTMEPTEWVADPMAINKIRLFNDDGAGNITAGVVAGKTGMECTSCHDVHNGPRVKDAMLLTGQLTGSSRAPGGYICAQCHLK